MVSPLKHIIPSLGISILSLDFMEPNPEFRLLPHCVLPKRILEYDVLTRQHFDIKAPKHLGDEQPGLTPRRAHSRTCPWALAKWPKARRSVVFEGWIPVCVIRGEPALWSEALRLVEIPWASSESEMPILHCDLKIVG